MFEVYSLVVFAHVLAAVALVGHSLSSPIARAMLKEAATVEDVRRIVALEGRMSRSNPLVALVLLGTGIYLGSAGWWYFGWFYLSIALWVVNSLLAARVVGPWAGALAAATAEGQGRVSSRIDALRRSKTVSVAAQVMLANDIGLLFVMMNKPSLVASAAVLAALNAALVAFVLVPRRAQVPELSEVRS